MLTIWMDNLAYFLGIAFILVDIILTPILEVTVGAQPDISALDGIRGNFLNYALFILFMWVIAAFGEKFIFLIIRFEPIPVNPHFWSIEL